MGLVTDAVATATAALAAAAGAEAETRGAITADAAIAGAMEAVGALLVAAALATGMTGVLGGATTAAEAVAEGTAAGTVKLEGAGTATPGALIPSAAGTAAGPGPTPSLLSSLMFLDSSARRFDASWACLSLAILSSASAPALPWIEPLDSVNLSGVLLSNARSSTLACTLPAAWRSAPATWVLGTPSASLRLKVLKSLLWATMVWLASPAEMALAACAPGTSSTAPALMRLTLPAMNASGLPLSKATSIWSSDTLAGLF